MAWWAWWISRLGWLYQPTRRGFARDRARQLRRGRAWDKDKADMKISTILDHIDSGHMALPEFQRGYV